MKKLKIFCKMQQKYNYLMYNNNMTFIYNYCNISF